MASRPRLDARTKKLSNMPPPRIRPSAMRAQSATPAPTGRSSPADSVVSRILSPGSQHGGTKRKQRDFESDAGEETNINVVVRCRGRNEREVRENSGVVVSTNGIKGNSVQLSMGPTALSNKTYNFDKVFSPAADQNMVFDEVVSPILDEVLAGFNCTIFAYGQTGTGKTYTMSGDISDQLPLPDAAGIIPRVLHALFSKLESDDFENSVKCSFIELYNEELRDLLAPDDHVKLKIFEDNSKKGNVATIVQGMEETHIKTAVKGIQLLREGSHKRQVAATKCNDLSSRSHTVFTVTVYMKRPTDTGEDFVSAGKLNLVDLAGSENIQRSGAENKRAAEAGLINKSLLTLGRVINALVDKGSHIPYRESKLTRLLQDSLGGRTKTCIIATLSPAKSNLEETISTLDYAFRAKNIRNKPQVNQMVSKKTLLKEFTSEIERLKSELIATRQRNGVYLTEESYEQITTESESRRILSEEQRDKIETLETNLRNKVQELFSLTTNFNSLKKDNEATKLVLDGTRSILEKTEVVLAHTKNSLSQETKLRKAHEATESNLAEIGHDLISTLGRTTTDIDGLHSKLRRRSDLQSTNRKHWVSSQNKVSEATSLVEERMDGFRSSQETLISTLSSRMQSFVQDELAKLGASQDLLQENVESFKKSEAEVNEQTAKTRDEMNVVLEEVVTLREDVKEKVGAGLNGLSAAAQRISAGIMAEIEGFQTQLHSSYASLGREFKGAFDDLLKQLSAQQLEANELSRQMLKANATLKATRASAISTLTSSVEEERKRADEERAALLAQITSLVDTNAKAHNERLSAALDTYKQDTIPAEDIHEEAQTTYGEAMDTWTSKALDTVDGVSKTRDSIKAKIKGDFATANDHCATLRETTSSVHDSTTQIVADQLTHLDTQLHSLDDIVTRLRAQNNTHHEAHIESLSSLSSTVQASYDTIGAQFSESFARIESFEHDVQEQGIKNLRQTLPQLGPDVDTDLRKPLHDLRNEIQESQLHEYVQTGETPQRVAYDFPMTLPRTESYDALLAKMKSKSPSKASSSEVVETALELRSSPSKTTVFTDEKTDDVASGQSSFSMSIARASVRPTSSSSNAGSSLRELDINVVNAGTNSSETALSEPAYPGMPPLKRQNTTGSAMLSPRNMSKLPLKKSASRMTVAGLGMGDRENVPIGASSFSASIGQGGSSGRRGGRALRSQGSV
ncbi:kinesin heavy chain [Rhizodiscina lignyota]|uniref:Kinesin heavy chain n=1 Tax=Rhizodiscina lignyota TaxID=1504668 RepID=A0A9P4M954_9PEZI|nr:kinesin heavy chain [Rhizodiscina lignyota]